MKSFEQSKGENQLNSRTRLNDSVLRQDRPIILDLVSFEFKKEMGGNVKI